MGDNRHAGNDSTEWLENGVRASEKLLLAVIANIRPSLMRGIDDNHVFPTNNVQKITFFQRIMCNGSRFSNEC